MTIAMAISERKQLAYMDVMIERAVESEKAMLPRARIRSVHIPEEEIRKKVLRALEEIIENNSHKYPIEDPNSAIEELKELGISPKRARSVVVENLIGLYKFEEARKLSTRNKGLQAKIRMGQLSKLILDSIKEIPTEKD